MYGFKRPVNKVVRPVCVETSLAPICYFFQEKTINNIWKLHDNRECCFLSSATHNFLDGKPETDAAYI